jgi:hypothetical protein
LAHHGEGEEMRKLTIVLACGFTCLLAQASLAAGKFKRFPRCTEGPVMMDTCECHAGTTGRFHYCHAGHFCHTFDGTCG